MLADVDGLEVVGTAATGAEAVGWPSPSRPTWSSWTCGCPTSTASRRPDVSDNHSAPAPPSSCSPCSTTTNSVFAAMRAGAHGYLLKGADQDEIVRRSGRCSRRGDLRPRGRRPSDPALRQPSSTTAASPLTEREREVLGMIAAGKGNATIAHELMIA